MIFLVFPSPTESAPPASRLQLSYCYKTVCRGCGLSRARLRMIGGTDCGSESQGNRIQVSLADLGDVAVDLGPAGRLGVNRREVGLGARGPAPPGRSCRCRPGRRRSASPRRRQAALSTPRACRAPCRRSSRCTPCSIRRISSSRATMAAGTMPPRVIATTPCQGPSETSRQASALAWRLQFLPGDRKGLGEDRLGFGIRHHSAPRAVRARGFKTRHTVLATRVLAGDLFGGHQADAVDPPAAVGLLFHPVDCDHRAAVGPDQADRLTGAPLDHPSVQKAHVPGADRPRDSPGAPWS